MVTKLRPGGVVTDTALELTCLIPTDRPKPVNDFFYEKLPHFRKLVSLRLGNGWLFNPPGEFWATKRNLRNLTLSSCTVPADVLVNVVNSCTTLQHLKIYTSPIIWGSGALPVQSRSLQELTFDRVFTTDDELLLTLFSGMSCKEATIIGAAPPLLIQSVQNSVTRLDLQFPTRMCHDRSTILSWEC